MQNLNQLPIKTKLDKKHSNKKSENEFALPQKKTHTKHMVQIQ